MNLYGWWSPAADQRPDPQLPGHSKLETVAVYDDNRQDFAGQIARHIEATL